MSFWKRSCTVVCFGKVAYIPVEEHRKKTPRNNSKTTKIKDAKERVNHPTMHSSWRKRAQLP